MQKQPSTELNDSYVAFLAEQLQLQLDVEVAGEAGDADEAAAASAVGAALAEQLLSVYQVASDAGENFDKMTALIQVFLLSVPQGLSADGPDLAVRLRWMPVCFAGAGANICRSA